VKKFALVALTMATCGVVGGVAVAGAQQASPHLEKSGVSTTAAPATGLSTLSRGEIEQLARRNFGVNPSAPVFTAEMTKSDAESAFAISLGGGVDPSRPVWVVTVNVLMHTDGGPSRAPKLMHSYSAIVNAESGQVTDDCIGCSWLSANE